MTMSTDLTAAGLAKVEEMNLQFNSSNPTVLEAFEALKTHLSPEQLIALAADGRTEIAAVVVELVRISQTPSLINNDDPSYKPQLEILIKTAEKYSFKKYFESIGSPKLNKKLLLDYFDYLRIMLEPAGFNIPAGINSAAGGGSMNLWPGTKDLAQKIHNNPSIYKYLPASHINHPELVLKVLKEIENPMAFMELMLGDTWENLKSSPDFLKAFALQDGEAIMECVSTVALAVQAGYIE